MAKYKISSLIDLAEEIKNDFNNITNQNIGSSLCSLWDYGWWDHASSSYSYNLDKYTEKGFKPFLKLKAEDYSKNIIEYFINIIKKEGLENLYKTLPDDFYKHHTQEQYSWEINYNNGITVTGGYHMNIRYIIPIIGIPALNSLDNVTKKQIIDKILSIEEEFKKVQFKKHSSYLNYRNLYNASNKGIIQFIKFLLEDSWYGFEFSNKIDIDYDEKTQELIIDYLLPTKEDIPAESTNKNNDEWVLLSQTKFNKVYENIIYAIVLRTVAEIFYYDDKHYIRCICFNGKTKERSLFTGQFEEKYIISLLVNRTQIESIDLKYIDPKECFKFLKGVSASKLHDITEIQPIITPQFADKRIIDNKDIDLIGTPNIAEMDWEDFEHLVRQIFEWEFSDKGGEVKVTQSSRDGGVDAIVFDPDPIRGGKIIVQAKRYTNTVPVSAVRDLYGTIINEGANKGILITTSDYGSDSYKFAQGKPITLLNGGHLLFLLDKHGKKAHIDLTTAKEKNKETKFQR